MERDEARVAALQNTVDRLGTHAVHVVQGDGRTYTFPMPFDRVLVDAPCSGLGVLARRADARWRKGPEMLDEMPPIQLELLVAGGRRARPGGVLVYSVCSFEPEETTEVVERFLRAAIRVRARERGGPAARRGRRRARLHARAAARARLRRRVRRALPPHVSPRRRLRTRYERASEPAAPAAPRGPSRRPRRPPAEPLRRWLRRRRPRPRSRAAWRRRSGVAASRGRRAPESRVRRRASSRSESRRRRSRSRSHEGEPAAVVEPVRPRSRARARLTALVGLRAARVRDRARGVQQRGHAAPDPRRRRGRPSPTSPTSRVEQAEQALRPLGLQLSRAGERFDPAVPRGFVLSQDPAAGTPCAAASASRWW